MMYAVLSLAVLGAVFGLLLGVANKKFAVEVDPRVEAIIQILPGTNCGSCGFPGCGGYAEAIVAGTAPLSACTPGGEKVQQALAEIMCVEVGSVKKRQVVQLLCNGGRERAALLYEYEGLQDCHVAATMFQGPMACSYGCLGLGSCVQACPFGGIQMGEDQLPVIDYDLCSGCGVCVDNCPQHVLKLVEASQLVHVRCLNKDKGKQAKDVCQVACIKCKLCERNCPEGAITVVADGEGSIAVIDYAKCTNCGICVEKCPTKVIEKMLPFTSLSAQKDDSTTEQTPSGCQQCNLCK